MEICRNKKTGQGFIYLTEQDKEQALMITPHGDVKALEHDLFTEPVEFDDDELLVTQGQINSKQYSVYKRYHQT